MNFDQFQTTLDSDRPPDGISACLTALWHEARDDWDRAHKIVQEIETASASWVHAYLHRKEGDESNARYWYGMAGKPFPAGRSLDEEWRDIAEALCRA
ncbi:MAG: hypothetical protein SF339_22020 [Blastocatellia bacterium]|nr:hypothetical protein [Blastocatellia bacterium]